MSIRASLLAALITAMGPLASTAAFALPVIPGASGFGINTPAGRGGTVYRVTNLQANGPGSLNECVTALGPRVCVFEVSGTITLNEDLEIRNPNITIAGQTAPSPGILLRGGGLLISASDVLVQHIRVRTGDSPNGPSPDNRDALKIESSVSRTISNVVVDHSSFSWSTDELASVWAGAHDVSLLNSVFAEPLDDSIHPVDESQPSCPCAPHGYGPIIGPASGNVGNISLVGNVLAHFVGRGPRAYASFAMVNNVVYNYRQGATDISNRDGVTTNVAVVGNVYLRGADFSADSVPVEVRGAADDGTAVLAGSQIFLSDNSAKELNSDPWSVAWVQPPLSRGTIAAGSAPIWPTGLVAKPSSAVLSLVLAGAGARPADRDAVDARIIAGVRTRTGQIINCVSADGSARCAKNGGGWPVLAQRTRTLALPANPNQVAGDGYTNLEHWLQAMAAEVEGRSGAPAAPLNTQVQ
jgi:hypothetical protein